MTTSTTSPPTRARAPGVGYLQPLGTSLMLPMALLAQPRRGGRHQSAPVRTSGPRPAAAGELADPAR
jgi:hypothetical protein